MLVRMSLENLLKEVRACSVCADLPLGPRPVLAASRSARILIVGQAPGTRVHKTGIPWNDPSGDRLRSWMNVSRETFYDSQRIAIVPMGFCYPGKGKSGDLPPRPECAPLWHARLLNELPNLRLKILAGSYAQAYFLEGRRKRTLTETVRASEDYGEGMIPLPHPSPRNNLWLRKNPWFEERLIPRLQSRVKEILGR
jgi:uracil-DNA glycosylase